MKDVMLDSFMDLNINPEHKIDNYKKELIKDYLTQPETCRRIVIVGRGNGKSHQDLATIQQSLGLKADTIIMDEISTTNIKITDDQKEALSAFGMAFKDFAAIVIKAMNTRTIGVDRITDALLDYTHRPKMDYTQKHKSWRKDRFYY